MNRFTEFLDAYAATLSRLATELDALHRDISELRNEMRGSGPSAGTHDEPELELQEAA